MTGPQGVECAPGRLGAKREGATGIATPAPGGLRPDPRPGMRSEVDWDDADRCTDCGHFPGCCTHDCETEAGE